MKSKIFLDMDGLLADLFSTISHKLYKKEYKFMTPEEKTEARKIWTDRDLFYSHFGDIEEFFANLEPFNNNRTNKIVNTVVEFTKENSDLFEEGYCICSHPASLDSKKSEDGKRAWIKNNLKIQPNEEYYPDKKSKYAKSNNVPNVLIDDYPPYIQAWKNAGGIPIEMRTDSFNSTEQVKNFLIKELNTVKEQIDGNIPTFKQYTNKVFSRL